MKFMKCTYIIKAITYLNNSFYEKDFSSSGGIVPDLVQ